MLNGRPNMGDGIGNMGKGIPNMLNRRGNMGKGILDKSFGRGHNTHLTCRVKIIDFTKGPCLDINTIFERETIININTPSV